MPQRVLRRSGVAAICAVVAWIFACGSPHDPKIPDGPDASGAAPQTACFGAADGTPCEGNRVCVKSTCTDAACGDGLVTPPEECDLGQLNAPGSGCEPTCKFSCVAGDATRGCPAASTCVNDGTCDTAKHTCTPGAAKAAGAACGTGGLCKGDVCEPGQCGDAVVTPPEECDNGSANGPGKGCESDCKKSCSDPAKDCPADPCSTVKCAATNTCASAPNAAKNGTACGTTAGYTCSNGACVAPGAVCGNGIKEGGEDCDFGTAANGPNTGCEANCKLSCTTTCPDANSCVAASTCSNVTVGTQTGKKCVAGAAMPDGSVCGIGSICRAGTCSLSVCGDGFRDQAQKEECDDSNLVNLDGCDGSCKFEQDHRVTSLQLQFATDAYCTANALGGAIGFFAQSSFQKSIDSGIKDGSVSALFAFASGGDLTGVTGNVTVGSLSGDPTSNAPPYDGTNELDWWYNPNPAHIDANRKPRATLTGAFGGGQLNATGTMNLIVSVGNGLANLAVSGAKIQMPIGATSAPTNATGTNPPGHLASENDEPGLKTFQTSASVASPTARMCGNVSALSLDNSPVPTDLLPGGANACVEGYGAANRLLDVMVNGCKVTALKIQAIKPTNPDQVDPAAPATGAGGPYTFAVDASKRVTTCKDKAGVNAPLQACLAAAAYSISFKYASERVIIR
jgi:cysteine-rich repeat protein